MTYDIAKLSDGKKLAKVCYYGTKAAGDEKLKKTENIMCFHKNLTVINL
ncbi:thioester domain-containing protein [Dorea hominis]